MAARCSSTAAARRREPNANSPRPAAAKPFSTAQTWMPVATIRATVAMAESAMALPQNERKRDERRASAAPAAPPAGKGRATAPVSARCASAAMPTISTP